MVTTRFGGTKVKIRGTIFYTIDKEHKDYQYYKNPDAVQKFSDVYTMDTNYFPDQYSREYYIKNDLALVAGGGYTTDHIHNVSFEFERVY